MVPFGSHPGTLEKDKMASSFGRMDFDYFEAGSRVRGKSTPGSKQTLRLEKPPSQNS